MSDEESNQEEDLWGAAAEDLEKQREMLRDEAETKPEEESADVSEATTGGSTATSSGDDSKYARILDIPLSLSVELGDAKMLINDLLQLGQGSVIELAKLVGEPLDVRVNSRLVAKGEVVVVNEKFGVRLVEVLDPKEIIENLG